MNHNVYLPKQVVKSHHELFSLIPEINKNTAYARVIKNVLVNVRRLKYLTVINYDDFYSTDKIMHINVLYVSKEKKFYSAEYQFNKHSRLMRLSSLYPMGERDASQYFKKDYNTINILNSFLSENVVCE